MEPKFGNFIVNVAAAAPPAPAAPEEPQKEEAEKEAKKEEAKKDAKKEQKPKKAESAGLSAAETKELESLKQSIIERKAILKEQGKSGGEQNKDPEVVKMVERMNELKEKQERGSTKKEANQDTKKSRAPLSAEEQKELSKLQDELEVYKHKLRTEFSYSNKDMKNDPDLAEMEKRLAELEKRER